MSVKTALILCAGFGKRLEPLTKSIPKPLLKIKDITLLERTLQIIDKLEIKEVKINTFYLEDQIIDFIKNYKSSLEIEIIKDGKEILDTGGGILNLINSSEDEDFIVFPLLFSVYAKNQYPLSRPFLLKVAIVFPGETSIVIGFIKVPWLLKGGIK